MLPSWSTSSTQTLSRFPGKQTVTCTGVLTPVAELEPVQLAGTVVSVKEGAVNAEVTLDVGGATVYDLEAPQSEVGGQPIL